MGLYDCGSARINWVDSNGRAFVDDVSEGDCGCSRRYPHSIQGLGPDGCQFLLVFNDGNFDEFETFLADRLDAPHAQGGAGKEFQCGGVDVQKCPQQRVVYIPRDLPGLSLKNRNKSMQARGQFEYLRILRQQDAADQSNRRRQLLKIVDRSISRDRYCAAIVTVKPAVARTPLASERG